MGDIRESIKKVFTPREHHPSKYFQERKVSSLKECAINSNHQAFKLLSKGFFSLKSTPTINKSFIDSLFALFREFLFLITYCIVVWLVTSFKGIETRGKANPNLGIGLQAKGWLVFWVVVGEPSEKSTGLRFVSPWK